MSVNHFYLEYAKWENSIPPLPNLSLEEKNSWPKLPIDQKIQRLLEDLKEKKESLSQESVEGILKKCWKLSKDCSKGIQIIAIRETCLTLNPELKNKENVLFKTSVMHIQCSDQLVAFPKYYKRALAKDSEVFDRLFYAKNFRRPVTSNSYELLNINSEDLKIFIKAWLDQEIKPEDSLRALLVANHTLLFPSRILDPCLKLLESWSIDELKIVLKLSTFCYDGCLSSPLKEAFNRYYMRLAKEIEQLSINQITTALQLFKLIPEEPKQICASLDRYFKKISDFINSFSYSSNESYTHFCQRNPDLRKAVSLVQKVIPFTLPDLFHRAISQHLVNNLLVNSEDPALEKEALEALEKLKIRELHLPTDNLNKEKVQKILEASPNLTTLYLLDMEISPALFQFASLAHLSLLLCKNCRFQEGAIQKIVEAAPQLKEFYFLRCNQPTDQEVALLTSLKQFQTIYSANCSDLTGNAV